MKLLRRNTMKFKYYPHLGDTDFDDDYTPTGEFHPTYGQPVTYRGNISAPSGKTEQTFFGEDIRYTHVLLMDDLNADIREEGIIAWDVQERAVGSDTLYTKEIVCDIEAVRPSLNVLCVALRRRSNPVREDWVK